MFLRPWYTENEPHLRIPESLSEHAVMSLKAEHVDAFRNGKAFSVVVSEIEDSTTDSCYDDIGYSRGILAWVSRNHKNIHLKCLASGKSETLASPDGTDIEYILLDGCTLVATTAACHCYVWKLLDGVRTTNSLKVSTSTMDIVYELGAVVTDSILAMFYVNNLQRVQVTTMDTQTNETHEFETTVSSTERRGRFKAISTSDGKSLVLFGRVLVSPSYVYFRRIALDGTVESEGKVKHPDVRGFLRLNEDSWSAPQVDGCVTLWTYLRYMPSPSSEESEIWLLLRICYVQDHLEVREQKIDCISKTPLGKAIELFWWKDIVYLGDHLDQQGRLEIIDLKESICKPTKIRLPEANGNGGASLPSALTHPWLLVGDENFLICFREKDCIISCFDRHLAQAMPVENKGLGHYLALRRI